MNKVLLIQLKTQKGGSRTCDIVLNKEDLSLVEEDQIRNVKTKNKLDTMEFCFKLPIGFSTLN